MRLDRVEGWRAGNRVNRSIPINTPGTTAWGKIELTVGTTAILHDVVLQQSPAQGLACRALRRHSHALRSPASIMMLRRRITTASTALLGRCLLPTTPRPSTSITTIVRRYASEVPHGKSKLTPEQKQKNRKIGMWAVAIILATLGASYASVPLYRMFCRV